MYKMKTKIKKGKRLIAFVAIMLICSNMFSQGIIDMFIDAKITNLHYNSANSSIDFTLKLKAGENYVIDQTNNGLWFSDIFIDFYPEPGIVMPTHNDILPYSIPTTDAIVSSAVFRYFPYPTTGVSSAAVPYTIKPYRGTNYTHAPDLFPTYKVAGYFSIKITGTPTSSTYAVIRTVEKDYVPNGPIPDIVDVSTWSSSKTGHNYGQIRSEKIYYYLEDCPAQALWTGIVDNDWFDSDNWVNPANGASVVGAPCATTDVYIPGSGYRGDALGAVVPIHFPSLNDDANCNEITFFQGGQVGRIDRLTYNKARVQLNFPGGTQGSRYYDSSSPDPTAYYKFAKGYSSPELSAGQWHMLSLPIQGVYSGDLGYGGFPMTFMRKFNVENDDEMENYVSGDWSESYKTTTETLEEAEGFAFYMYPQGTSFGTVYSANDNKNITGSATNYGLGATSGIIEFPTYDNAYKLNSHRIQSYASGVSIFYDVAINGDLGEILDGSTPVARSNNDYKLNTSDFITAKTYNAQSREVLVGNPYMSALDFSQFYSYNRAGSTPRITNAYRIWNGTTFIDYNAASETATSGDFTNYIAPMQSFFVTGTRNNNPFTFDPEDMSVVVPKVENVYLRSTQEKAEQNIIRLSAINQYATTSAVIAQSREAVIEYKEGEDITKLFSPSGSHSYVSEIYSLAGETALSMNYIGEAGAIVPIGIRVPASGSTTLKLTGMNNYDANRIELIDGKTNMMIADITNLQEYEYSFDNKEGGYQSGRFYLRITESTTGTGNIKNQGIQVYKSGEAIHVLSSPDNLIKQIRIYDVQGRILYSDTDVATDIYRITEQFDKKQVLIVQVTTENNTKSVKINN